MTDTKGGFLSVDDDPNNRAMAHAQQEEKPAGMTMKEWERLQLLRKLRQQKAGPFEPGISALEAEAKNRKCRECGSLEIDFQWEEVFNICLCNLCKDKFPDKYSLLTKTEAREDYLLTDPELKDEKLLPRLERPNPHKSTWNNMQLYLRFQVEEYAFSDRKWGSSEALDAEFEKRQAETKRRKEKKFKDKLADLKKRTLFDAHKRQRATMLKGSDRNAAGEANFGDRIEGGKHVHEWGRSVQDPETGMSVKRCTDCGMEVEELEF